MSRLFLSVWLVACSTVVVAQTRPSSGKNPKETTQVRSDKRVALVIGNGAYASARLANPVNDAQDMAATLARCGFTVTSVTNADKRAMRQGIRTFIEDLDRGSVALFYFAGHAVQSRGENYMIPVGADVKLEDEIQDECVSLTSVLGSLENAKTGMNLIILDACRDNPFRGFKRSLDRGLKVLDAPKDSESLIAYATAPEAVAADGTGRNGIYTACLLKYLTTPNLPVETVFKQVRKEVKEQTGGQQVPWVSMSMEREFYFVGGQSDVAAPAVTPAPPVAPVVTQLVQSTKTTEAVRPLAKQPDWFAKDLRAKLYPESAYLTGVGMSPADRTIVAVDKVRLARRVAMTELAKAMSVDRISEGVQFKDEEGGQDEPVFSLAYLEIEPARVHYREKFREVVSRAVAEAKGGGREALQEKQLLGVLERDGSVQETVAILQALGVSRTIADEDMRAISRSANVSSAGSRTDGSSTGAVSRIGKDMSIDLGDGVKMEFVWVEPLKGWVGKYEVTNQEYRRFKKDHDSGKHEGQTLNEDRQPVVLVSYDDATAFAEWVNKQAAASIPSGCKARLPDGKEWMTFAQCGDGRTYPWGNDWPPKHGNYADATAKKSFSGWTVIDGYDDGFAVSCPVEKSGANDWGLYGVGGNVLEWTSEQDGSVRVLRGASWNGGEQDDLRCGCRNRVDPSDRGDNVGFRLVVLR